MAAQEYHIVGTDPIGTGTSQSLSTYGRACPPRKPVAISFEDQNNNLIEASHNSQEGSLTKVAAQNGAKTLRRPGQQVFVGVLIDVCLANLPCAFIALGFIAVYLDDQPISSYGRMVEESARLGPTIFPIAFAAIVARFTKHLARWQAERGQRLGVLEQLIQSQSFAASIEAAYSLRSLTFASFAITVLWAFSPLGGQSSLRILSTTEASTESQLPVYAAVAETLRYFGGGAHAMTTQTNINGIFVTSLMAPQTASNGPTDTWGNVRIPASHYVEDLEPGTWYTADESSGFTDYSSLVGIPVWGVPDKDTVNFSITWPIFNTDCQWKQPGYSDLEWCYFSLNHTKSTEQQNCTYNATDGTVQGPSYKGLPVMTSTDPLWLTEVFVPQLNSSSNPVYMAFAYSMLDDHEVDGVGYPGSKAECKLRTVRAEAQVFCASGACRVTRLRRTIEAKPDFINVFNDDTISPESSTSKALYYDVILRELPATTGPETTGYGYATPFTAYLLGRDRPFNSSNMYWLYTAGINDTYFSQRLSTMFNTFWIACQWTDSITDRSNENVSAFLNTTTGEVNYPYQQSIATVTQVHPTYKANYLWIVALIIVSTILLFCALTSLLLRVVTVAPDILGFVSSLTRDSRYFEPLPPGSSMLDGEQRARRLRDRKVQIADVRPEADVGHIAFVSVEACSGDRGERQGIMRLRKDRLYD